MQRVGQFSDKAQLERYLLELEANQTFKEEIKSYFSFLVIFMGAGSERPDRPFVH